MHSDGVMIVGHYSHDRIIGEDGTSHEALGGPPAYISNILSALRVPMKVISKVGDDFLYFDAVTEAPTVLRGKKTTRMIDDYRSGDRCQIAEHVSPPIEPDDISGSAKIGMAAGHIGELPLATLQRMRSRCSIFIADIQGLIRQRDHKTGGIFNVEFAKTAFAESAGIFDYLKASRSEAEFLDVEAVSAKTRLIVTLGEEGCALIYRGRRQIYPVEAAQVVDPTGAGDCFLAGFAYGLYHGMDEAASLRLANICGRMAVQQIGVPRIDASELESFRLKQ